MIEKNMKKIENYFEVILILTLIFSFLYLIKDFIIAIFLASTFVFLTYKPYKKLLKKINNKIIASSFICFLVISCICLPSYLICISLIEQTSGLYYSSNNLINNVNFENCNYFFCQALEENIKLLKTNLNLNYITSFFANKIISSFGSIFDSISNLIINFFIFILAFFFILKDGEILIKYIKRIIPIKNEYKQALFLKFKKVSVVVFYDTIFIAIMQGILVGFGLWAVGINSSIFWGCVAAFFGLIPMIGTTIVWFPAIIYLFITNQIIPAIFLSIYSLIIVSLSDNFVRAFLLNKEIHIHPFLVFISVIGGLDIFGFFGLFIGPIIVSLLICVLDLYKLDFT